MIGLRLLPILVLLAPSGGTAQDFERRSPLRYESLRGNIRGEVHMLPPVSTGPMSPTWSPDGAWIAFAMAGDIWRIPSGGGAAEQLTQGPAYHFEPSWSPEGDQIAMTLEDGTGLDLGLLDLESGEVRSLVANPGVDAQPTWGPEGRYVYFSTALEGSLDIYRVEVETGLQEAVVGGRGNQIQPRISPDGVLAYVAPAPGVSGSGGVWMKRLPDGEPTLIHAEETSYRARPDWLPNGQNLVFVTDEGGSNDLALIASSGGNVLRTTFGPAHELTPAVSPNGETVAFVSNGDGATKLHTMPTPGGAHSAWQTLTTDQRAYLGPMGRISGRVLGPGGLPTPSRVSVVASDGRAHTPRGGFHKVLTPSETHFFRTTGEFEVEVPAGPVTISVRKGLEYRPAQRSVTVEDGESVSADLSLSLLTDASVRGWYGGDTHTHDLHQGRFGLTREAFFDQLQAEDLRVSIALIHMDGTRLMGRWEDLTGGPSPLSTETHRLQYAQEFRGSFGHVGLLGVETFVTPLIGGAPNTPFAADVLNATYLEAARIQGGIGGFMHPFNGPVATPADVAASEIPVDAALGAGEFYDVICFWYDELDNAEVYYRLLNAGIRLAATGGTDNFSDAWRDPGPGASRTYAQINGEPTVDRWIEAIRRRRTFATNGPLLFLTVDGEQPGSSIDSQDSNRTQHVVRIDVASNSPLERIEIVANGEIVSSHDVADRGSTFTVQSGVPLEGSGWIAARALGPASPLVSDSYAFAQTTPVWIVKDDHPYVSKDDAEFLLAAVETYRARLVERDRWDTDAARAHVLGRVDAAAAVYRRLIAGTPGPDATPEVR